MKILLADAIRSGEFGPVRLGMTKDEVRRALGAPDDMMSPSRRRRESPCWFYGDVEIYFAPPQWTVSLIFADEFKVLDGGTRLEIESGSIRGGMGWDEVVDLLEDLDVPYEEVPAPSPELRWLRTRSGVTLAVVVEQEEFGSEIGLNALWWQAD
ncbi:MAG: hypothetical protein GY708_10895 [Actinomycetia bacterium]|nr:hypothetical protein [Actinomycetes bacterium]